LLPEYKNACFYFIREQGRRRAQDSSCERERERARERESESESERERQRERERERERERGSARERVRGREREMKYLREIKKKGGWKVKGDGKKVAREQAALRLIKA
jgi:hypothetical protein